MSQERRQILDMLTAGKISSEEAEKLLDKLDSSGAASPGSAEDAPRGGDQGSSSGNGGRLKYLRVVVNSDEGDQVNIRVPLALVRTGIKLSTMLPSEANEKLKAKGIDLSQLGGMQGEELVEALRDLTVDVNSSKGDVVRVFCE